MTEGNNEILFLRGDTLDINTKTLLKVIKLSAQIMLENGGETYRAEETIKFIGKSFNVYEIECIATPTGFYLTVSVDGEDNNSIIKRIKTRTIDLQKISDVNNISRQLSSHTITLEEALAELEEIQNDNVPQYKHQLLYAGLTSAFFAILFGGGWFEFIISFLTGILVAYISRYFVGLHSYQFVSSIISGTIIAFISIASTTITGIGNYNYIIVGALMPLLPGLAMTNAIRDTMRGDLISGSARATEALLVASSLAAGAGSVIYIAHSMGLLSV